MAASRRLHGQRRRGKSGAEIQTATCRPLSAPVPSPRITETPVTGRPNLNLILFRDPLGRDGIAGREGLFDGLVDQLLLAQLQVLARNPVTGRGRGGPAGISLSRALSLLARWRARAARSGWAWSGVRWAG